MRNAGIRGIGKRRGYTVITRRDRRPIAASDLVNRHFTCQQSYSAVGGGHDLRANLGRAPVSGGGH